MKSNSYRMWLIELFGDGGLYHQTKAHETIDGALCAADEEESEVDWTVNRITITALAASSPKP